MEKIISYKDLQVWQKGIVLVRNIYAITNKLPNSELYNLTTQMRRSAISIPSNIAEGYRRKNIKEYIQFLSIAIASAAELETQLIITHDIYNCDCSDAKNILEEIQKMLYTLIKKLNPQPSTLNPQCGFTLMELLIAMAVFAASLSFAVGSFVHALKTQRTATHLMAVQSNASLGVEQVAREMRTGYNFVRDPDDVAQTPCTQGANGWNDVRFTNHRRNTVVYRARGGALERGECSGAGCVISNFQPLTASNVKIENLCFIKTQATDNIDPWRITIAMTVGSTDTALARNKLDIQTTVSARILPVEVQ